MPVRIVPNHIASRASSVATCEGSATYREALWLMKRSTCSPRVPRWIRAACRPRRSCSGVRVRTVLVAEQGTQRGLE